MTNTIQQLKEEMIDELDKAGHLALYSSPDAVRKALDKVIKATADAMVGEKIGETERFAPHVFGYNTRIQEEQALRHGITQ